MVFPWHPSLYVIGLQGQRLPKRSAAVKIVPIMQAAAHTVGLQGKHLHQARAT